MNIYQNPSKSNNENYVGEVTERRDKTNQTLAYAYVAPQSKL